jgi:hypothetical protein
MKSANLIVVPWCERPGRRSSRKHTCARTITMTSLTTESEQGSPAISKTVEFRQRHLLGQGAGRNSDAANEKRRISVAEAAHEANFPAGPRPQTALRMHFTTSRGPPGFGSDVAWHLRCQTMALATRVLSPRGETFAGGIGVTAPHGVCVHRSEVWARVSMEQSKTGPTGMPVDGEEMRPLADPAGPTE